MNEEILYIEDVFQLPRGTVVIGVRGDRWGLVKIGDPVELRTQDGRSLKNAVRDLENALRYDGPGESPGAVLLVDAVASDQLPRGTRIVRASP
jgi:hypothetical protein